jgi:hypothetical protein
VTPCSQDEDQNNICLEQINNEAIMSGNCAASACLHTGHGILLIIMVFVYPYKFNTDMKFMKTTFEIKVSINQILKR